MGWLGSSLCEKLPENGSMLENHEKSRSMDSRMGRVRIINAQDAIEGFDLFLVSEGNLERNPFKKDFTPGLDCRSFFNQDVTRTVVNSSFCNVFLGGENLHLFSVLDNTKLATRGGWVRIKVEQILYSS
eukprot:TRINITY_DN1162_c0_g1_i12.p2 TRINITY_DN1162_c0_g1~~TRINITY_DN1162_c0_g1_i12.p2  ORF type:complete len:129 (-),score=19.10 TRINITY_DN1162_c0_g1_i12:444-830(-)